MYIISKKFTFSASHRLEGLPECHPCSQLHGHNYTLTVFLKNKKLNKQGFVQDYNELKKIKEYVTDMLDHKHLNDIFVLHNPTVENMAKLIFDYLKKDFPLLCAIELSETDKTNCRYEPED